MARLYAYTSRRLIEKLIYEKKRLDHRAIPFERDRFIVLNLDRPFFPIFLNVPGRTVLLQGIPRVDFCIKRSRNEGLRPLNRLQTKVGQDVAWRFCEKSSPATGALCDRCWCRFSAIAEMASVSRLPQVRQRLIRNSK